MCICRLVLLTLRIRNRMSELLLLLTRLARLVSVRRNNRRVQPRSWVSVRPNRVILSKLKSLRWANCLFSPSKMVRRLSELKRPSGRKILSRNGLLSMLLTATFYPCRSILNIPRNRVISLSGIRLPRMIMPVLSIRSVKRRRLLWV